MPTAPARNSRYDTSHHIQHLLAPGGAAGQVTTRRRCRPARAGCVRLLRRRVEPQTAPTRPCPPSPVPRYGRARPRRWCPVPVAPCALRETRGDGVGQRPGRDKNTRVERDHRGVQHRFCPPRGSGAFDSAARRCPAHEGQRRYFPRGGPLRSDRVARGPTARVPGALGDRHGRVGGRSTAGRAVFTPPVARSDPPCCPLPDASAPRPVGATPAPALHPVPSPVVPPPDCPMPTAPHTSRYSSAFAVLAQAVAWAVACAVMEAAMIAHGIRRLGRCRGDALPRLRRGAAKRRRGRPATWGRGGDARPHRDDRAVGPRVAARPGRIARRAAPHPAPSCSPPHGDVCRRRRASGPRDSGVAPTRIGRDHAAGGRRMSYAARRVCGVHSVVGDCDCDRNRAPGDRAPSPPQPDHAVAPVSVVGCNLPGGI